MRLPILSATTTPPGDPPSPGSARLRGRLLTALRLAWLGLAAATLGLLLASVPPAYTFASTPCPAASCASGQLGPAAIHALHGLGLSLGVYAAYGIALQLAFSAAYAAAGVVIFWRRSDDRTALLVSFALLTFGATTFTGLMDALASANRAWHLPVAFIGYVGSVAFTVFLYTFPNGRFVPSWTRWVALLWAAQQAPQQLAPRSAMDTRGWPIAL